MMQPLSEPTIQASLRQHHHKLTRSRQAVLNIVVKANRHLTAAEVYRKAKARHSGIGLTTVYRTLDLLVELGYIQRVHLAEGCHSYASVARPHGHHLVCAECGRAEAFEDCDLASLTRALQARTGYQVNLHVLELMGRCPACQSKARSRKR
jgi:Fur family ferric uptake transcriptional regulator